MKKNKLINHCLEVALVVAKIATLIDSDLSWVTAAIEIVEVARDLWLVASATKQARVTKPMRVRLP